MRVLHNLIHDRDRISKGEMIESLKIRQYLYIYIYKQWRPLQRYFGIYISGTVDQSVSRMAIERKNSITRVSNAIFVTVVAARACPSSFLCPYKCMEYSRPIELVVESEFQGFFVACEPVVLFLNDFHEFWKICSRNEWSIIVARLFDR